MEIFEEMDADKWPMTGFGQRTALGRRDNSNKEVIKKNRLEVFKIRTITSPLQKNLELNLPLNDRTLRFFLQYKRNTPKSKKGAGF